MRKSVGLAVVAGAASVFVSSPAQAAVGQWVGPNPGNWSASGNWTGSIPNGQGDTALYGLPSTGSSVTVNDVVGGVRVGTIQTSTTTNGSWQITPNQDVTFDQDGTGPLSAAVRNDMQATNGTTNTSIFLNPATSPNTGAFILADDLLLSNTSNSTRSNGSIQIRGVIKGTGNIRIENVSNNILAGHVAFTNGGQYGGNTTIAKGATTFTRGDAFAPSPGNTVIIGSAGGGAATLMFIGTGVNNMENQFASAAGAGGTLVFGMSTAAVNPVTIKPSSRTSTFTLNGDLNFSSPASALLTIGEPIAGVGKLIKIGAGPMRVTDSNSYQGGTRVDGGSLAVGHADAFNNGFGSYPATDGTLGTGDVTVNSTAVRVEIESGVAAVNVIGDTANVSLFGGGVAGVADAGCMLLGSGVNETIGMLLLNDVAQPIGTYGSTASAATFKNDEYFSGTGILNVTLVPEPTSLALAGFAAVGLLGRRRRD